MSQNQNKEGNYNTKVSCGGLSIQERIKKMMNEKEEKENKNKPNPREEPKYNINISERAKIFGINLKPNHPEAKPKSQQEPKKELIKLEEKGNLTIYKYQNDNFPISNSKILLIIGKYLDILSGFPDLKSLFIKQ